MDQQTGRHRGGRSLNSRPICLTELDRLRAPIEGADPAPLQPPSEPLSGDTHAHLLEPACDFARSLGYTVSFEATPAGVGGWCDRNAKRIVVDTGMAVNAQLRTLIHETTHALGVDYERFSREQAEVIVDSVTYIVCSGLGLAVDGETIPYVAGWGENGALEAVNQFAHTIHELSRRVEEALHPLALVQPALGSRLPTTNAEVRS